MPDNDTTTATLIPGLAPTIGERCGTWFLSIVAIIFAPLLPLLVEAARNNMELKSESLLLTTAVLAVGFAFSSLSNFFRAAYGLLFLLSIGLNYHNDVQPVVGQAQVAGAKPPVHNDTWIFSHPGLYLIIVCILHAIELLQWHVGEKKNFPDWLK